MTRPDRVIVLDVRPGGGVAPVPAEQRPIFGTPHTMRPVRGAARRLRRAMEREAERETPRADAGTSTSPIRLTATTARDLSTALRPRDGQLPSIKNTTRRARCHVERQQAREAQKRRRA